MDTFDFLHNHSIEAIESLYQQYLEDPNSVDTQWAYFFKGFDLAKHSYPNLSDEESSFTEKEFKVINLIQGYRQRGHLFTKTNPVRQRRTYTPTLDIEEFGLGPNDLKQKFKAGEQLGIGTASLEQIQAHLNKTYCQSIGVEYLYIRDPKEVNWLMHKMESTQNTPDYPIETKLHIFEKLVSAVGFEKFIHKKFTGQKRFSLEGAETLIPSLDAVIEHGADLGIQEFIIGMSHRGRLNVLANILKKPYEFLFREFTGKSYIDSISLGDVKYHLGYGNNITTHKGKTVRLNLAPNPSHLEAVAPVVEGIAHAKIKNKYAEDHNKLAPIIIHGDAAVAGQGVVYEVVQMAGLAGYKTGGTIHLVINNQVGFTTSYLEARSSTYCTDVAKVTRCPVFHVNGDDVEALIFTIKIAMEYRQKFHKDVFIDILSYRKYGHNEGDEPRYTQPILYKSISRHPNPRELYATNLIENNLASRETLDEIENQFMNKLEDKLEIANQDSKVAIKQFLIEDWKTFRFSETEDFFQDIDTRITKGKAVELAEKVNHLPEAKEFFKKIIKLQQDRNMMVVNDQFDWAMGELMAYASLIDEGIPVRISGQDSQRGTFSHRHAALSKEKIDERYIPLQHMHPDQASFDIYNSPLNEYAVMGFEYGYSLATPKGLTIWEAQFGDFHNVAQVIIDQYISSAEEKWGLMNGLVLLLPHGYEGQGPEHSSARMERFLILCAKNNMQLMNCTTPANLFHALRQQVKRDFRTPLVIFTPKSLLRHPKAVSSLSDLSKIGFQRIIQDSMDEPELVTRVVLCTGKIYYDLLKRREKLGANDVAIIRVEQIYPLPTEEIKEAVAAYPNCIQLLWVQEEPKNMGAWQFIKEALIEINIEGVYRMPSGSPAVGLHDLHEKEQEEILLKVFKPCTCQLQNTYCGLQCKTGKERTPIFKQHKYFKRDEA